MPSAIVIGGGLAGLASAAALGQGGFQVGLFEARAFLGGRATSYPLPGDTSEVGVTSEVIDNCQHVLLRCCVNLMDFYRRLGVADRVQFHKRFYFIEPGGRTSILEAGALSAPLHFTGSFQKLTFLGLSDKIGIARALWAIRREHGRRQDLDRITMLDWLREKRQTETAIGRFWNQVLVSSISENVDRMAASQGFQVFWLGFLARANSYEMGVPSVPLGDLYGPEAWKRIPNVQMHLRAPVEQVLADNDAIRGVITGAKQHTADYYISSLPFERLPALLPQLGLS